MNEQFINPFTDFGFKKLFGTEPNKDLLIDFLNTLLPPYHQISDLTYRNSVQTGNTVVDRSAIFDLYCQSSSGERFLVELQKAKQNFFKERSVYYSTFPIQEQAPRGEWDFSLKAVYAIGILDFVFDEDKYDKKVLYQVKLLDTDTNKVFYDKLTYFYLAMPNFSKKEEELETHFDRWLYVLKHLPYLQKKPARLQEKIFQKLFDEAQFAKLNPAEFSEYEHSLKLYRDLKNVVDTAREKGKEEGRAEGVHEEKRRLVHTMKAQGFSIEVIMQLSGLREYEIEKI